MVKKHGGGASICRLVCGEEVVGLNPGASIKILMRANPTFREGHMVAFGLATCPLLIGPVLTKHNMPHHHL